MNILYESGNYVYLKIQNEKLRMGTKTEMKGYLNPDSASFLKLKGFFEEENRIIIVPLENLQDNQGTDYDLNTLSQFIENNTGSFSSALGGSSANTSTIRTGEVWSSLILDNKPSNVILDGDSFNNADYPALATLSATMNILTDNGDGTTTLNFQNHFPRPSVIDIGVLKTDTTARNGLGVVSRFNRAENTPVGGGAFRLTGTGSEINVNGVITGDSETAPLHFGVYCGIYGS